MTTFLKTAYVDFNSFSYYKSTLQNPQISRSWEKSRGVETVLADTVICTATGCRPYSWRNVVKCERLSHKYTQLHNVLFTHTDAVCIRDGTRTVIRTRSISVLFGFPTVWNSYKRYKISVSVYFLIHPVGGAEYCDECVCMSVRLSAIISRKPRVQMSPNILCLRPATVTCFSSSGVVIRYVFPVLRMTSCFYMMGPTTAWRCGSSLATMSVRPNTPAVWYWLHPVPVDGGAKARRVHYARGAGVEYVMHHFFVVMFVK